MQNKIKNKLKKFWNFLNEDSWQSTVVFILLFLVLIMYVFSPLLGLLTGFSYSESIIKLSPQASFPFLAINSNSINLVIVESCSMYHKEPLEKILENKIYSENNISLEKTKDWNFKRGFSKGDIIFSIAPKNIKIGDVIIFNSEQQNVRYPIIHRIIRMEETLTTKGDNNPGLLSYEKEISNEQVLAKSIFRVPYLGWIKLMFFEWQRPPEQRGFC
jgi:hypothetical protein